MKAKRKQMPAEIERRRSGDRWMVGLIVLILLSWVVVAVIVAIGQKVFA